MNLRGDGAIPLALLWTFGALTSLHAGEPSVDLSSYRDDCGVTVRREDDQLSVAWPMRGDQAGHLVLDLRPGQPLIRLLGIIAKAGESAHRLFEGVAPVTFLLVGSRQAPGYRPPEMSVFNV